MADVNISSDVVQTSKLLGVVLDCNLCFADMINNACRVCFFKLINLQSIRHFLLFDTKYMLLKSFITSCFDYISHLLNFVLSISFVLLWSKAWITLLLFNIPLFSALYYIGRLPLYKIHRSSYDYRKIIDVHNCNDSISFEMCTVYME